MALIACPECGQNILSVAGVCPHCGMPIDPRRTKVDYVTGEVLHLQPRAAAHVARRPLRYPTRAGVTLMVGGGGLVVLGSVMPWVRNGPVWASGLQSDGRLTVVLGMVMVILAMASRSSPSRFPRVLVMLGAGLAVGITVVDISRLRGGSPDHVIGVGVAVVLVGGLVALVGSFLRSR